MPNSAQSSSASKLRAALLTLQALNVQFCGPFATPKRRHIYYVVDQYILTPEEIVTLYDGGQISAGHIAELLSNLKRNQSTGFSDRPMTGTKPQTPRRSQRVPLQIGILLRAELPGGDVHQVQAFTRVVNAHGGLLEAPLSVAASQRITLANLLTGEAAVCKVVQVEGPSDSNYSIAFEFDGRNPHFWPIPSPPDDWIDTKGMPDDDR